MTSTLTQTSSRSINSPTVHQLSNGLTIVAEQLPVEAVNLNVWLNVGSVNEPDSINGMAHFLEHMVFKGTPQLEMGEFERLIEQRGAVTNAATSQDYTHYYITTAPHDFAELAPLQLDVVFNATIPPDAFERERFVVLEEIRRSEDNPGRRSFRRAMEMAFERLPYRRPVLGPSEVIEQVTAQQMQHFHHTHYQPRSTTVAVVGNLPAQRLIEIVEDSINTINPQLSETPLEVGTLNSTPEASFNTITRQEIIDDSLQQARMVIVWRTPGLNQLDETYALDILATILGQGRTARLVRDLRENRGLVSSISVSHITQRLQGVFYISVQLPVQNLAEVEAAVVQHIERVQTELISEAEIARVRTQVANRYIFGNETPSDRAGLYGYYQSVVGDLSVAFNYPAQIQAINTEDLQTAAQHYLQPTAYGVTILKPTS
ncbi:MAG: pitrilysin family protein [Cyanobacteria bacterium J06592_8]